jgi:hypothetical protein
MSILICDKCGFIKAQMREHLIKSNLELVKESIRDNDWNRANHFLKRAQKWILVNRDFKKEEIVKIDYQ